MRAAFLAATFAGLLQSAAFAQTFSVTLNHANWQYRVGERAEWTITADHDTRVTAVFTFEQQRLKPLSVDTIDLKANVPHVLKRTLKEPGLLRLIVRRLDIPPTEIATAAFDPEEIKPSVEMPKDFEDFWRKSIAAARENPLEAVMTPMPERSRDYVDVYHINFQNTRGTRIYGILSMPKGPGPFPALLILPGAGVRPYFPSYDWAKRGVITLSIGIHGIPVDRDSLLYNELRATALSTYFAAQMEDRDRYYYRRVFIGAVRAGDFIFDLPQFDKKTYVIRGGSQGGGLSIITTALDPRVIAYASDYPAMSDHFGYLKSQVGGWPHIFADTLIKAKTEKMVTMPYYDAVNFARLIRVPGFFAWGFNDPVVPPHSMYAAYNVINAPKQLMVYPPAVHGAHPSQREAEDAWLRGKLGVK
ncbi:MAG TPA: acetylxylan esterase [Longimicrobiales bacterium]|nr:acetylxylan esterase [Longimicrobiales bacterium]